MFGRYGRNTNSQREKQTRKSREAGRQNARQYTFTKLVHVCLSLQMAKVFEKVLRADVLGGAGLLKGQLSTDPRGRFKLGKLGGGGRGVSGVYQCSSKSAFSKLQFGQGTELTVKNNYV